MSKAESKWDRIYKARKPDTHGRVDDSLLKVSELLPKQGSALDVAGGDGKNAVWLAKNGFDVTLLDVSSEALRLALELASISEVDLDVVKTDLESKAPKDGPWDLIIIFNYYDEKLYQRIGGSLRPGGTLVVSQATIKNLERHSSPSSRYLLDEGELTALLTDLTVIYNDSGWRTNGRHELTCVAKRPI